MMYQHEVFTDTASAAYFISKVLGGSVQSYNIAPDTEMYIVTVRKRYGHAAMVQALQVNNINFEEVITNKLN